MPFSEQIRFLALGAIRHEDRIFLSRGFDPLKQETFYRLLGGGVDFGETSLEALKREFKEEIDAELANIEYLGCLESIFVYGGKSGHEIIQLYRCDFADPKFYQLEQISFQEGKRQKTALWVDLARFRSKQWRIVPEKSLDYL